MNCPRCYTELPDSATTCAQCGAPVRPATFSYLPAGAPAWPTSVPQDFSYGQKAIVQTAQDIRTVEGSIVPKSVVAQKKSSLGIPAIIGLFLVSILIGGGVTFGILYANGQRLSLGPQSAQPTVQLPTPGASAGLSPTAQGSQLPTPTSFQKATSAELGIALQYPADWIEDPAQQTSGGNTFVIFHPRQSLPVGFNVGRLSATNSSTVTSTTEINQVNLQGFGSSTNLQNMQVLTNTPQHRTIGGASWDEMDATYLTSSGTSIHLVSISVEHNKLYYNILFFAPSSVYDEAVQKYYSQMLNTFQFTS